MNLDTYFPLAKLRSFVEVFKRYLKPVFDWPSCSVCTVAYKGSVGYRAVGLLLKDFVSPLTHHLPFRIIIIYRWVYCCSNRLINVFLLRVYNRHFISS